MDKLFKKLESATESFKQEYVDKIKTWATDYYEVLIKRAEWTEIDWCKYFNVEPEPQNEGTHMEFMSFPKGFYRTKQYREYKREQGKAQRAFSITPHKFVENAVKKAEKHFELSLIRLSDRIKAKDLNQSNIVVEHAHVGVNLEMVLTDGDKIVKAWTIIASGEIQQPHYRYLVR